MKTTSPTSEIAMLCWLAVVGTILMACEKPFQIPRDASKAIELSLTLNPITGSNVLDGSEIIPSLVKSGIFPDKPSERLNYRSYYIPKTNIQILGSKLVYYDHEYIEEWIGCCPNSGNAVVLLESIDTARIKSFAKMNKCKVTKGKDIYLPDDLWKLLNISEESKSRLIEVSCKERNDERNKNN